MGQSRNENILENMLGAHNPLGEPQSREEALLMQILEQGGGGDSSTLAGLTDVSVTSPSNEQILKYDGETGKWVNDNIENEIKLSKTAGPSSIVSFISETDMAYKSVTVDIVATGGNGTPENPNPINGYTEANITANGDVITIAFGQTVYGGVLDVTRGKLHVTWAGVDLGSLTWEDITSGESPYFRSNVTNYKYLSSNNNVKCSCYQYANIGAVGSDVGFIIISSLQLRIRDNTYPNATAFKTAMQGQIIAYELATPFDIDLTPEVISAVVGTNNVFADCGETTVGYYNSIGESIHDLVEESVELWTDISGTLEAGETEITLTNSAITASSTIEVFNDLDVPYISKELSAGSITLTFDAQESDMSVKVRVS